MSWVILVLFLGFIALMVWVVLSELRQPLRIITLSSVPHLHELGWELDTDPHLMRDPQGREWVIWDDEDV